MKLILLTLILPLIIAHSDLFTHDTYHHVKSHSKWESYDWDANPFKNYSTDEIKSLFGVKLKWTNENKHLILDMDDHSILDSFPSSFDTRKIWPECKFEIRNQLHCGSCWAFSAADTLTDRFCIHSKTKIKEVLSPQDIVSCDAKDHDCEGGMLDTAWEYIESFGLVSERCFPYISGDGKNIPHCLHGKCVDESINYKKFKALKGSSKSLTCPAEIKNDIFKYGPVQTGFIVYEDFLHYKGGIYEYSHGEELGGHAVKIVGWGEEKGIKFWIAENSWGPSWGEDGYFRIKLGECMFDENAYSGVPKLDDYFL